MHSFTLKGRRHIWFPKYLANILLTAASRTLWKQPRMCVLSSGSSKSCGKSPGIHFCWSPPILNLSIFKWIPMAIFIQILQLKYCRKRCYLLFRSVYISILLWQRHLKYRYWVRLKNRIGWLPYWRISQKHLSGDGIRNKIFLLVFTSVVLSQKHGESDFR